MPFASSKLQEATELRTQEASQSTCDAWPKPAPKLELGQKVRFWSLLERQAPKTRKISAKLIATTLQLSFYLWKDSFRARLPSKTESWRWENEALVRNFREKVKVEMSKQNSRARLPRKSEDEVSKTMLEAAVGCYGRQCSDRHCCGNHLLNCLTLFSVTLISVTPNAVTINAVSNCDNHCSEIPLLLHPLQWHPLQSHPLQWHPLQSHPVQWHPLQWHHVTSIAVTSIAATSIAVTSIAVTSSAVTSIAATIIAVAVTSRVVPSKYP